MQTKTTFRSFTKLSVGCLTLACLTISAKAGVMRYEVAGPSDIRPFDLAEHFRPSSVYHKDPETGQLLDANNQAVNLPPWSFTDQNYVQAWNRSGTIVGESFFDANDRVGFLYQNGTMTYTDPKVGRIEQQIMAINDLGQAVGGGYYGGAFLYDHGVKKSLGDLPGLTFNDTIATDINHSGLIVGQLASSWANSTTFVYQDGAMQDLNQVTDGLNGLVMHQALAVTDDGWILASAWDKTNFDSNRQIWLKPLATSDTGSTSGQTPTNSTSQTSDPGNNATPASSVIDTTSGGFWTTSTNTPSLSDTNSSNATTTPVTSAPVPVPEPATWLIWAGAAALLALKARR